MSSVNLGVRFWGMDGVLSLVAVSLRGECQLAIGCHLVGLILQQARHVSVGNTVVVATEADVVLLQFNGPKGGIELAVLVLPVGVHASHEAQQQQHHQDDDGQDDNVELRPGDFGQGCCSVVGGATQAGQQGLGGGGGGGAQCGASVAAAGCGGRETSWWRGCAECECLGCVCVCWCGNESGGWTGTVMCLSVPYEARSTELALGTDCVVDAMEAVACIRVTELGGALRVCIPIAVTWDTSP